MKFKKSLNLADKLGARYALIIGSDEVASGTFTLKRLADADQQKLSEDELLAYLESEKRGTRGCRHDRDRVQRTAPAGGREPTLARFSR